MWRKWRKQQCGGSRSNNVAAMKVINGSIAAAWRRRALAA
jgi:hypothetical protein